MLLDCGEEAIWEESRMCKLAPGDSNLESFFIFFIFFRGAYRDTSVDSDSGIKRLLKRFQQKLPVWRRKNKEEKKKTNSITNYWKRSWMSSKDKFCYWQEMLLECKRALLFLDQQDRQKTRTSIFLHCILWMFSTFSEKSRNDHWVGRKCGAYGRHFPIKISGEIHLAVIATG